VNQPIKIGVLLGEHIAQMPESLILSHDAQSSYWNQLARGKRNSDAQPFLCITISGPTF
jgi:hypothetical protein